MEYSVRQPNPFLIDHVIEQILEYVGFENQYELFKFRLVCNQWNYYSSKLLKKKHYLSFGGHKYNIGRLKNFLDDIDIHDDADKACDKFSLDNSNRCEHQIAKLQEFPIVRFRLFSDLFQEHNKSTVLNFIQKCGPQTEALVIYKDINSDIEYSSEELGRFKFPQLKELTFADRRRSHFSLDANLQTFLFQIVSSSKETLTSLSIKFPREPIYEIYEKEELIIKVLSECRMPRLQHLNLDMSITDKVLVKLSELNLGLKGLQLCLGASQFSSRSLKLLLNSLKSTLEDLKFKDLYRRASLTLDLPRLDCLQSFEVHGLELPAYFVTFPDFTYESKFPNLRKLRLNTWAPTKDWEVFVPEKIVTHSVVKELSLAMNFDCPILMKRVSSMFSQVRVLEMHFSRSYVDALKIVFQFMPQLEELKLNQSYLGEMSTNCIDDVLTGLDADDCKWILRKKAYKTMDLNSMEKKPNLTDLKNLKKLDILPLRYRNLVTDVSAHLVFLQMESLRTLDIGRSEISEGCLRQLAERFPNGKFQKYLNKKAMKYYDNGLYKNSVFTSICSIQ